MDPPTHIAAILAALANGDDPFTGLPLPPEHVLTDDRIRAALATAAGLIDPEMEVAPRAADNPQPPRQGKAWDADEQARLVQGHDAGKTHKAMAQELGRTTGAIRSRLVHLGLVVVETPKGDERFLRHFERAHLLSRCVDQGVVRRAARLMAAQDPSTASSRLDEAVARYAERAEPPLGLPSWDLANMLPS